MLAQIADLRLFALLFLCPYALMSLRPYVPAPLCLRTYVLRTFVCALMQDFAICLQTNWKNCWDINNPKTFSNLNCADMLQMLKQCCDKIWSFTKCVIRQLVERQQISVLS